MRPGTAVTYKAGDQPNNALSLNVLQPGEMAATAGTSGVIYGIADHLFFDRQSRVNSFAHVNYAPNHKRIGVLLCINGVGIFNKWIRQMAGANTGYPQMNTLAAQIPAGSEGLFSFPFGNGTERMFNNRIIGAQFSNINLNTHHSGHLFRAVQEGIAFSFRYGMDILRENGMNPTVVRANKTNMFQSDVFSRAFAELNQVTVEFYEGDGSYGAAMGAGMGAQVFADAREAFADRKAVASIHPNASSPYPDLYEQWKQLLSKFL